MNVDLARIQFAFTSINHFFFVPVTIDGKTYVDGGVVDPVPADAARKLGADLPLVVHFETATGRAFVRSVDGAQIDRIASEERDRLAMLGGLPAWKAPLLP